jgi:ribonuclease R
MNKREMERAIREYANRTPAPARSAAQWAAALDLKGKDRKRLRKLLPRLLAQTERAGAPRRPSASTGERMEGRLQALRSGRGLVRHPETGQVAAISATRMGQALHGDWVEVEIRPRRAPSRSRPPRAGGGEEARGTVLQVLRRNTNPIVGELRRARHGWRVIPLDPRYRIALHAQPAADAREGEQVVVRFADWPAGLPEPLCEILETLGDPERPGADTEAAVLQYGLRAEFPAAVLAAAAAAARQFADEPARFLQHRTDLRALPTWTVDPRDARDFDDAVSLTRLPDDRLELGVHIADVAAFVPAGGVLDQEAFQRGTSVYFPDRVLPMLPEQLSNGLCSLKPGEDRAAISVFMLFDAAGRPLGRRFARSLIRSAARLTYEQAQSLIAGADPQAVPAPLAPTLLELHRLAQTLRARRMAENALDFDIPEPELSLDEQGRIRAIRVRAGDAAHQLIEECMVAANEAVARELHARQIPALSRYHEAPDPEKLQELSERLKRMGYAAGRLDHPRRLAEFLRRCQGDPLEYTLRLLVLRSMKRACYSAREAGHFGLAKRHYTHFTSPIRRYPDLAIHRRLVATLWPADADPAGSESAGAAQQRIAVHASQTEREADQATRDVYERMTLRHLLHRLRAGDSGPYEAVVAEVRRFGCFVDLPALRVQGLIPRERLTASRGGRHRYRAGALETGGIVYRAGTRLSVAVAGVDMERRLLHLKPDISRHSKVGNRKSKTRKERSACH